jgi:ceramide glucosyltransferase
LAIKSFFEQDNIINPDFHPPISILKPLYGIEDNIYQNLESFIQQSYPEYQIIFCVKNADDPVIKIVEKLINNFPKHDLKLVINDQLIGFNYKVSNLANGLPFCQYDLILIADSDIQVKSDYLSTIVQPFENNQVAVVTCLYQSPPVNSWVSILESLTLNCTFIPSVLTANQLEGISFAFGSTILIRKDILIKLGGFKVIANSLADDFLLGNLTKKLGYQVILAPYFVNHCQAKESYQDYLARKIRWNSCIKVSRFWSYLGMIFTQGTTNCLFLILLSIFLHKLITLSLILALISITLRLIIAYLISVKYLQNQLSKNHLSLILIADIVDYIIWFLGLFNNQVKWKGETFIINQDNQLRLKL